MHIYLIIKIVIPRKSVFIICFLFFFKTKEISCINFNKLNENYYKYCINNYIYK